jgi:hypothetical protein
MADPKQLEILKSGVTLTLDELRALRDILNTIDF